MSRKNLYPRFILEHLSQALKDSPLALIHGPRQCGKTTLAQYLGKRGGYQYFSFDEPGLAEAVAADPVGFVADLPNKVILDEVQRVPGLFGPLKLAVDRDPRPGQAILTGSANVLLLPNLSDSLAGRMQIVRLHPLARCEISRRQPDFLNRLFKADFKLKRYKRLGRELAALVCAGGFPAALARPDGRRRRDWCLSYVEALLERDLRTEVRPSALRVLPKLLKLAAGQTAHLFNVSELAAPFSVSRPTISGYSALLERIFLLGTLPPWHRNRLSRLVKTPKLHMADSGLAAALLGVDAPGLWEDRELLGQLLETFVVQEIRRQASWNDQALSFHHYRDKDGNEVDLVIEKGPRAIAGIEIKATATPKASDFKGLRKLAQAAGSNFVAGVLLYDGDMALRMEKKLFAIPLSSLWSAT